MLITIDKNPSSAALGRLAAALRRGAVIAYPTDTAYALGCDATSPAAVRRIFAVKGRTGSKGLPLVVADLKMARKFFAMDPALLPLAARHWPGPLSLVLGAKKAVAPAALEKGTAAVRVPSSRIARDLSRLLGRPLAATSANLSGQPACYSAKSFLKQLRAGRAAALPDIILDAGALRRRRPSTIVRAGRGGIMEVLRQGPIKI